MKTRLFFTVFTFLFASNFIFASFPVNNNYVNEFNIRTLKEKVEVLVENSEITTNFNSTPTNIVDHKRTFQILSLSFSGASIICTLSGLLILGILLLIPAIVFIILYYTN